MRWRGTRAITNTVCRDPLHGIAGSSPAMTDGVRSTEQTTTRYSFSCRNRISRGARKPEKLSGSSIGSLPQ